MNPTEDEKRRPWTTITVCLMVLLPVLYVLAIGPLASLASHGYLTGTAKEFVALLYYPLIRASVLCPPLGDLVQWWIAACGGPVNK